MMAFLAACQAQAKAVSLPAAPPTSPPPQQATSVSSQPLPTPTRPPPTSTATPSPAPSPTATPSPTPVPRTTLLFTGVIVPARCVQAALDANGDPDYPYAEVREIIQKADLAVGVLNATMSDFPPHTGCVPTYVLVGSPQNAGAARRAGFDLMNVATNHIKDCGIATCGDRAFLDTLDNLQRAGIQTVGAGKNEQEALQPLVATINGVRFGFVALGDSRQGEWTFAAPDRPGIARLTDENVRSAIQALQSKADVIIALPHWGPEDVSTPTYVQRDQAQQIVEAGADLVVGSHTHVVQGIQEIDGVPVFYGLGNFVFDQGLRDHRQGAILLVHFEGTRYAGYDLIPTHVDRDGRVYIADPDEAAEIVKNIEAASAPLR